MNYFDGIEWVGFNHVQECRARIGKHFHDYYVLDYNHGGELTLQLDNDQPMPLKSPVAWFTFPGPFFRFGPASRDGCWDHRHISFRGERVMAWAKAGLVNFKTRSPVFPVSDPERFAGQMDEIMAYLESPAYGSERAVQMFEGLLLQLHEKRAVRTASSPAEVKILDFITRIDGTPEQHWDCRQVARRLGLSYPHFRLLFRGLTGLPPGQYIRCRRMEKSARLLRQSRMEIKDIANQVGYEDIFHFSKLFKKHFRVSPGRFRARSTMY